MSNFYLAQPGQITGFIDHSGLQAFDEQPHLQLMKELLQQAFTTPRRCAVCGLPVHKGKPQGKDCLEDNATMCGVISPHERG